MRHAKFTIDTFIDEVFDGFTQNDTWNGWARPFFNHDEAQKIVSAHKRQGLNAYYDQASDEFAFEVASSIGDYDVFPCVEISGMKLYPVGAGCWIWEEVTEEGLTDNLHAVSADGQPLS